MKMIIAAIKPFKLEDVRQALTDLGVAGLMVTEVKGFGAQSGHTEIYRGAEYEVNFVPKVKLELVVPASLADRVVDCITTTARTRTLYTQQVSQYCRPSCEAKTAKSATTPHNFSSITSIWFTLRVLYLESSRFRRAGTTSALLFTDSTAFQNKTWDEQIKGSSTLKA